MSLIYDDCMLLGPGIGKCLAHHLLVASSYSTFRLLRQGHSRGVRQVQQKLSKETADLVIKKEKSFFYLQTVMRLAHIGNEAQKESFLLSYYLMSRGLSQSARNILARFGFGKSQTSYLRSKQELTKKVSSEMRSVFIQ